MIAPLVQENRKMSSKIWSFLNSQFFVLILGFFLTGLVGHYLTINYQNAAWEKGKKYEVFKQEIDEAKKTLEEVNSHISSRTYLLQKVHWELESNDPEGAVKQYRKYVAVKDTWNQKIRIYRNKLKRLVDKELAFKLLDSDNAINVPKKESVHAFFAIAHDKTRRWKNCVVDSCTDSRELQLQAHEALRELFQATDKFIDDSYAIFLKKYKELQESPQDIALTNHSS